MYRFFRQIAVLLILATLVSGCSLTSLFRKKRSPRLAFVIDDVGYHRAYRKYVRQINVPMTYAVLPFVDRTAYMSDFLHKQGAEIILHMPMASKRDSQNKEKNMIYPGMSKEQIYFNIEECLEEVPWAVGFNNHKGSAFTENYDGVYHVLSIAKEKNLFFLDSLTVRDSQASEAAEKLRMRIAVRDVFLDNEKNDAYIKKQIRSLVRVAKRSGSAIGIGHYHKETLKAIYESIPGILEQGVEIVFLSELI